MSFKNIVIAGGGVLGSQIAYQTAYKGFNVTFWLRSEGSIGRTQPKLDRLHEVYLGTLEACKGMIGDPLGAYRYPRGLIDDFANLTPEKVDELKVRADRAYKDLKIELNLAKAVADADLVIEAMSENPDAKKAFYADLAKVLPEKTVLCTNSSTMLPSSFADVTGRPEKFLALHFANEIWKNNTAEIMGHPGTDPKYYEQVVEFAAQIGMVPLPLKKEQPGYILNSMLVPFLNSAQALFVNGVADPKTIDMTWRLATGAPVGPFQILDIVGLKTAYEIIKNYPDSSDPDSLHGKIAAALSEYIEAGKLGVASGEGFYKYK